MTAAKVVMHMALLKLQPGYEKWMNAWVIYDADDRAYVGFCPDETEICRDSDPQRFMALFKEAVNDY